MYHDMSFSIAESMQTEQIKKRGMRYLFLPPFVSLSLSLSLLLCIQEKVIHSFKKNAYMNDNLELFEGL
jgi:hypothetical protein